MAIVAAVESGEALKRQHVGSIAPAAPKTRDVAKAPNIWFEVEDLLLACAWHRHPTGLERVALEIIDAAQREFGGRIGVVRMGLLTGRLTDVGAGWLAQWCGAGALQQRAPGRLAQRLRCVWRLTQLGLRTFTARRADKQMQRGDVIVSLGGSWIHRGYAKRIAALKKKRGVGFACMIHDIIPLVERDRVDAAHVRNFRRWLPQMLRVADRVFTPSDYARADLQKYARKKGWKMPPVSAIRYGPGLLPRETPTANAGPELPQDFVACVSTITAHKNQAMLVRLWRRLLQRHEAASVPHLVLVGAIGGKPESFRAELAQSAGVREKIIVLSGLTDAELASVYARCRLTLFPSFSEGWGLPVEESLAFGKFCISSNRASLPEVGGDWVDYFDPGNDAEAYAAIERALFQPGYLEDRTARIQRDYRAPTWTACARHMVATIDAPGVAASSR